MTGYEVRYEETLDPYGGRDDAVGVVLSLRRREDGATGTVVAVVGRESLDQIARDPGVTDAGGDARARTLAAAAHQVARWAEGRVPPGRARGSLPGLVHEVGGARLLAWARLDRDYPPLERGAVVFASEEDEGFRAAGDEPGGRE